MEIEETARKIMNLETIMTNDEKIAVINLIKAHLVRESAKIRLIEAEATYKQAARYLTEEVQRTEDGEYVSCVPHLLVIKFADQMYLVETDEEGSSHQVRLIGGIL
jgi:hypothetical protein